MSALGVTRNFDEEAGCGRGVRGRGLPCLVDDGPGAGTPSARSHVLPCPEGKEGLAPFFCQPFAE